MSFSTRAGVHTPRSVAVFAALAMLLSTIPVFFAPLPAHADPYQFAKEARLDNPDLSLSECGIDILMILDETGSMDDDEAALEAAYDSFINSLVNSGARVGVVDFSARNPNGNGGEADAVPSDPDDVSAFTSGYVTVDATSAAESGALGSYTPGNYSPNGYTNWQEALWGGDQWESGQNADLVVWFTDGNPNTVDADTPGHGGTNGELSGNQTEAAEWSIEFANDLKDGGTHILALGLGFTSAGVDRLKSVVGVDHATTPGNYNAATTDVVTFNNASAIATALETLVSQLCPTTLNVTKHVATSPDPSINEAGDWAAGSGWDFTISQPTAPNGIQGLSGTSDTTNGSGNAEFSWSNKKRGESSSTTLDEALKPGWGIVGARCSIDGSEPFDLTYSNGWAINNIPDRATVDCSVYNEPAFLTLKKNILDDAGSGADPSDFTVGVQGGTSGPADLGPFAIPGGNHTIEETGLDTDKWTAGGWSCVGTEEDDINATSASISLQAGDNVTCTVSNTAKPPILTLVKKVTNDDGGTKADNTFKLTATGDQQVPFVLDGHNGVDNAGPDDSGVDDVIAEEVLVGTYILSEEEDDLYTNLGWVCVVNGDDPVAGSTVVLDLGDTATCTVHNDDKAPGLTIKKDVTNAWGGTKAAGEFPVMVTPGEGDPITLYHGESVPNAEAGVAYTVSEIAPTGYMLGDIVCLDGQTDVGNPVTLELGQSVTCTVYNKDVPGTITVNKAFAHETDATADDFSLGIEDLEDAEWGDTYQVPVGDYDITEDLLPDNWVMTNVSCLLGDENTGTPIDVGINVNVGLAQDIVCTITNGELPTVTVEKIAIGEDPATFEFDGDLGAFEFDEEGGSKIFTVEPNEYDVTETQAEFWSLTNLTCEGGAVADMNNLSAYFEVDYGDHQKCTFTNEQLPKTIEIVTDGVCIGDAPYLQYTVNPINFDGDQVTVTWLDIDPLDPAYEKGGLPLQGTVLWPGTVLDSDKKAIDWPGWILQDDKWIQGDDGYQNTRPSAQVQFDVNPSAVAVVAYPGGIEEPTCDGPPPQIIIEKEVIGDGSTEFQFAFETVGFTLDDNTLADGDEGFSGPLAVGDGYSVSEVVPEGWLPPVVSCDDGSDPSNIDLSVGETVTCIFQNEVVPEVLASVLVTVGGSCVTNSEGNGSGRVDVTMSVPGGATVTIKAGSTVVATLTDDGTVTVPEDSTYTWEATPNEGFEFPAGFVASGTVAIDACSDEELPLTGLFADELAGIGLALLLGGALAVLASRRRSRHEGLDR